MSNKMWGGRFASKPDPIMEDINASIEFDRHLYRQDIAASKAHAAMLAKKGIITAQDAKKIAHGLDTILSEFRASKFAFNSTLEDIHMNIESRLAELIGPAAGRLHTARSRNDQVATDFRLWVRDSIDGFDAVLGLVKTALPEQLRETAYWVALEVALTDARIALEEVAVIDALRRALSIDKLTAAALERGARARYQIA